MLEVMQVIGLFTWGLFFLAVLYRPGVVKINGRPQSRLVGLLAGPFILLTLGLLFGVFGALILAPFTLFLR